MRNMIKNSWRRSRLVLTFCCLAISLVLVALPFSQSRTRAQGQQPKSEVSDNSELSVIEIPAGDKALAAPAGPVKPSSPGGVTVQTYQNEVEPNGTSATATALATSSVRLRGSVYPAADVDFYSFTASTGDRVYAAVQTLFDASGSGDTILDLISTDGTTVLETDLNDGTFNGSSSSIAGFLIPSNGTFFLRVRHNVGTGTIRPYDLHFNRLTGAPVPEVEPNDTNVTATPLPGSLWVSGTISGLAPEADFFSFTLAAGDSVYLSLDMNPERDANVWNGRLGFGLFGNAPANQILLANDANAGAAPTDPNSEAFFFTVKDAGTYFVYVDSIVATGLGANATYNLSVAVSNAPTPTGTCTTYTSTDVPKVIPTGPGSVSSTITVPGSPRIGDLDVSINLDHTFMADLDVHLVSPAGNDNGLFTDIGAVTVGGLQTSMNLRLDDEAALPPAFALSAPFVIQPELAYRLSWFDGENAGGVWTLAIRDDATGDGGTLNSWSITVCEPPAAPTCGAGAVQPTIFSTDFESGAAGFTHSGTADEWELGLPTFAAITTCNSGTNCWKTDLDNTYNASSSQDLISPNINLTEFSAPIRLNWAMRYQIESATFDHLFVDAREVGNPTNLVRVFEWRDATMTSTVGSPAVTINESAGWGNYSGDISALAGLNIELVFHVDSDTTVQLAGLAIDDVNVTACITPTAANGTINGRITDPNGVPVDGVVIQLSGTQNRKFITDANGNYRFEDVETNGFYSVTPSMANYHFSPESRSFSLLGNATEAAFTATRDSIIGSNRIDRAEYFVRQHYLDFLGREPDESGFNFWSDQILSCGADAACAERRTINVSAAYFLSIEFQETGGLVDGLYRASYGRRPTYVEFMPDTATVARNVIVGRADWAQQLEANKQAFVAAWVQRAEFQTAYGGMSNAGYVDALLSHTGVDFSQGERNALVDALNGSTLTRADALRQIAEDGRFMAAKRNEAFVMMQYFGYLRREPDDAGFHFWLNKLNEFEGNFERAEMVKAFLVSG
ncbi:MAG: DUF4214 domain-containing protein, partial [Pyrinomonadaceae bacterium]